MWHNVLLDVSSGASTASLPTALFLTVLIDTQKAMRFASSKSAATNSLSKPNSQRNRCWIAWWDVSHHKQCCGTLTPAWSISRRLMRNPRKGPPQPFYQRQLAFQTHCTEVTDESLTPSINGKHRIYVYLDRNECTETKKTVKPCEDLNELKSVNSVFCV